MFGLKLVSAEALSIPSVLYAPKGRQKRPSFLKYEAADEIRRQAIVFDQAYRVVSQPPALDSPTPIYSLELVEQATGAERTIYVGKTTRQSIAGRLSRHEALQRALLELQGEPRFQVRLRLYELYVYAYGLSWLQLPLFGPNNDRDMERIVDEAETCLIAWLRPDLNQKTSREIDEEMYIRLTRGEFFAEAELRPPHRRSDAISVVVPPRSFLYVRGYLCHRSYLKNETAIAGMKAQGVYKEFATWIANSSKGD